MELSPEVIGLIGVIIMVILLFSRMWIGATLLIVGFAGIWILTDLGTALNILGMVPYSQSTDYTMTCLPMFILMGVVLAHSNLGSDLFDCAVKWFGRVRGGLAMACAVACGFFAAVCGDSVTTAVTMGKVAVPTMRRYKYSDKVIGGVVSAGGSIGVMIPPSICFIIYGLITQESIGTLFIAGIIPGILQVIFYILVIVVLGKAKPDWIPQGKSYAMKEKIQGTKEVWPVLIIFLVVMGGIYTGWFTPTEAGAFGAFAAIIVSILNKRINRNNIVACFKETLISAAMVYFLVVGAHTFLRFMAFSNLPSYLGETIVALNTEHGVAKEWIILGIVIMYIILGMFMDIIAAIFLTLSIVYPIVSALGYDLIWFGVITVRVMQMGMVSPPFGLNLFAVSRATGIKIKDCYIGELPFFITDIIHTLLLILIPALSTWLVSLI